MKKRKSIDEVRELLTAETYERWSVKHKYNATKIAEIIGCHRSQIYKRIGEITGTSKEGLEGQVYVSDAYHKVGISQSAMNLAKGAWV